MSGIQKALGIISLILVLIIFAELFYYFVFLGRSSLKTSAPQIKQVQVSSSSNNLFSGDKKSLYEAVFDRSAERVRGFADDAANGGLKSVFMTTQFEGVVMSNEKQNKTQKQIGGIIWEYGHTLTIQPIGGSVARNFLFSEEEAKKIMVYKANSSYKNNRFVCVNLYGKTKLLKSQAESDTALKLENIKAGDKIFLTVSYDIMKPTHKSFIKADIEIL